jgi:hypothetical protein
MGAVNHNRICKFLLYAFWKFYGRKSVGGTVYKQILIVNKAAIKN